MRAATRSALRAATRSPLDRPYNKGGSGPIPPVVTGLTYIGPVDRRAPADALYVPYSDRANLQTRITANAKIYLDGGNYSTGGPSSVTIPADGVVHEIYGVANSTRVTTINVAAGALQPLIRDVQAEVIFASGALTSGPRLVGVNNGGIRGISTTIEDGYFMSITGSQFLFDNSAGGYTRNCQFLRHQTHNGGNPGLGGYWANKRCAELRGNADLSSYGNLYLVGNALTSSTTQFLAVNQDSVVAGLIDIENYDPPLANEGALAIQGCGEVVAFAMMGATVGQQTYNIDAGRAFTMAMHASGSLSPRAIISAGTQGWANWGRMTDDGTITDNGAANLSRFAMSPDEGPLLYNGGTAAPTAGAQQAAAYAYLVGESRTYIRLPKPTERTIKNPNPAWASLRAAAPDNLAALQALVTAAGNGGTVQFPPGASYISGALQALPNQNWIGAADGSTSITCKSGVAAAFVTNWSPPDPSGGLNPVSYSLNMSDITWYGDNSGFLYNQPNCQMTLSQWSRVAFRGFNRGWDLNGSYAMDNNTMIYVDFVCTTPVFQLGSGSVGPETPTCMYMDKTYFFRSQFEGATTAINLSPRRANNLNGFVDCYFKNCAALYNAQYSNFTSFLNCVAVGVSAAPAVNAASNWVACDIALTATGKFSQVAGMELEGVTITGASGATVFSPTAPGDPRDLVVTNAYNCDFSAVPMGLVFGPVGVRWESVNAYNTAVHPSDAGNIAGVVGCNRYFTNGTPTTADDVRANQSNFVTGVPVLGTRIFRKRGVTPPPPPGPTYSGVRAFSPYVGGDSASVSITSTAGRSLRVVGVGQEHGTYTVVDNLGNSFVRVGTDIAVVQDAYNVTLTEWLCQNVVTGGAGHQITISGPSGCSPSIYVEEFNEKVAVDANTNTTETGASPYDASVTTVATSTRVCAALMPWCSTGYAVTAPGYTTRGSYGDPALNWPIANLDKARTSAGADNATFTITGNVGGTNVPIKMTSYKLL